MTLKITKFNKLHTRSLGLLEGLSFPVPGVTLVLDVSEGLVTVGTHIVSVSWALLKNDGFLVD